MYCEDCGKRIEPGEICSCHSKQASRNVKGNNQGKATKNGGFGIYAVISVLFLIFGSELLYYFYSETGGFLNKISLALIADHADYISYGIVLAVYLAGIVSGAVAWKNRGNGIAVITILLNVIAALLVAGMCGKNIYEDYKDYKATHSVQENQSAKAEDTVKLNRGNDQNDERDENNPIQIVPEETEAKEPETENTLENTDQDIDQAEEDAEYISSVLLEADQLAQAGSFREAINVLTKAYSETQSELIWSKIESVVAMENESGKVDEEGKAAAPESERKVEIEQETEKNDDGSGIHRYEYFVSDCTWEEAFWSCLTKGGHLVTFESSDEYDYVRNELSQQAEISSNIFYIGGRRDSESSEYYWVDESDQCVGQPLNRDNAWNIQCWLSGEPSYRDESLGIEEDVLTMFYYKDVGRWVWNDVPSDLIGAVSSYKGKIGYICEYED